MVDATKNWRRFIPYEVTPIIACVVAVIGFASYRIYNASQQPEVQYKRKHAFEWTPPKDDNKK